ncbi:hypothetical protein [Gracilinema caldarium]|uniref:hypothetical protein n=1 Tax=Gracilinema caldarium TaxID=215591 RepID=UPI0012EA46D9|nr:hypothetical protein [Gracilinema caldarium]
MAGQVGVDVHHAFLKILVGTADREGGAAVGIPVGKELREVLFVPGKKEVRELMVVHRIGIGRVRNPQVGGIGYIPGVEHSIYMISFY